MAPENPPFNACSVTGSLPGQGIDGTDIQWEVTLFFNDQWRIQFQAFSEEPECVYPMKVKGAYEGADVAQKRFNSTLGMALGLTPDDHPELALLVDFVRIRTTEPNCD